jgi:hypothetical protein
VDPALPPPVPEPSPEALRLSVADALRLAVRASRDYQTQKETVYLAALALTLERHLFEAIPTATGTATLENLDAGRGERQRDFDGTAGLGISQKLATGMVVVGDLGLTALKLINKEVGDTVDSTLGFTFTQPLWRGAGPLVVQENLTQAERNALYAVRTFARYEQSFAVDMASQYLRVIQDRDTVLNEWQNYRSLVENRERAEWLAKSERQAEFQVDQARQDELRAYNRWIVTRQSYINALDAFKIELGIPVTTEIALVPTELDRLASAGLADAGLTLEDATAKALEIRFDLRNAADGLDDAARKVKVADGPAEVVLEAPGGEKKP